MCYKKNSSLSSRDWILPREESRSYIPKILVLLIEALLWQILGEGIIALDTLAFFVTYSQGIGNFLEGRTRIHRGSSARLCPVSKHLQYRYFMLRTHLKNFPHNLKLDDWFCFFNFNVKCIPIFIVIKKFYMNFPTRPFTVALFPSLSSDVLYLL